MTIIENSVACNITTGIMQVESTWALGCGEVRRYAVLSGPLFKKSPVPVPSFFFWFLLYSIVVFTLLMMYDANNRTDQTF
jgi:hypothetical protein